MSLTVLGLGNTLMSDEGVGVRLMEAVRDARDWPADVEFVDGGAGGLNLLSVIERAERLLVFDAAEMHLAPGEHRVVRPEQLTDDTPPHRVSMHDVSFAEVLSLAGQFFRRPDDVTIMAVQPKTVDYGRELSPELTAAMPRLVEAACELVCQAHRPSQ